MTKEDNGKIVEENNALMANGRTKPAAKTSLSTFIFNRREGTFLGRTFKSWVQIIVFYVIFYILLAAFWVACLAIFLQSIDKEKPKYYGKGTIIGDNPGVGYQPWLRDQPESTLIKFNPQNNATYAHYMEAIENYLAKYSNTNKTRKCSGKESNKDLEKSSPVHTNKPCRFDLSNFEKSGCGKAEDFGFKQGKPCIILSLNRLIGWEPKPYKAGEVPKEIADRYKSDSVVFRCNGSSKVDDELIGELNYIPDNGIDGRFYPYVFVDSYQQPIAIVKFMNLPKNRVVDVTCGAFAANIERNLETRSGLVTFQLLLQ